MCGNKVIVTPRPVRLATQGLGRMITIGCESDVSTCLLHALSVARRMWSAHRVSLVSLACNARLCGSALSAVDAWVLMESMKSFDPWDETGLGLGVIATVDAPTVEGGFQLVNMQLSVVVP